MSSSFFFFLESISLFFLTGSLLPASKHQKLKLTVKTILKSSEDLYFLLLSPSLSLFFFCPSLYTFLSPFGRERESGCLFWGRMEGSVLVLAQNENHRQCCVSLFFYFLAKSYISCDCLSS